MNVLQIIQSFCYETNQPAPSTLLSVTDPAVNQLISLFYAVGRDLRQAKCWPQLKRTHSFNTVSTDYQYALPADFYCSILDTYWDTTNKWKMYGPITDSTFNQLKNGLATVSSTYYFRVFGRLGSDQFEIYPTPGTSVSTLQFDYMSSYWLGTGSAPYTWSEAIVADTDVCAFDDDLMILGLRSKWNQAKGLDYADLQADYANRVSAAQARFAGNKIINMYPSGPLAAGLFPNIAEGNWTL